jgi:hypothetical protein
LGDDRASCLTPTHPLAPRRGRGTCERTACYDAEQNTLTFIREVHSAADGRLLEVAEDYWLFYEHAVLRDAFPIIEIIDGALWNAFMLIKEFGAARVFAYVAQTPFSIEENNVRASALQYQESARSALGW